MKGKGILQGGVLADNTIPGDKLTDEYKAGVTGAITAEVERAVQAEDQLSDRIESQSAQLGQRLDSHDEDLSALGGKVEVLSERLDGHDESLTYISENDRRQDDLLDDHDQRIETTEGKLSDYGSTITSHGSKISAIEGDIQTIGDELDGLKSKDAAQDGRLDALEKAVQVLEDTEPEELNARVTALESRADGYDSTISEHTARISSLESGLEATEGQVAGLATKLEGVEADVSALKLKDADLDGRLGVVEETVQSQGTRLTAAEGKITTLEGKADTAETDITELKVTASDHNTRIQVNADEIAALWTAIESGDITPDGAWVVGRRWNEASQDPEAVGDPTGDITAHQNIQSLLRLGCYIVGANGSSYKLDPLNHYKYEDGATARLDGTDGNYMWGSDTGFYYGPKVEGGYEYSEVSNKPFTDRTSYYIPPFFIPATGFATYDHQEEKLCAVVSNEPRYRGGEIMEYGFLGGSSSMAELDGTVFSQLGKHAVSVKLEDNNKLARAIGAKWGAEYYVANAVVKILFPITHGTRNIQADYRADKDANGLYQGGLGSGVLYDILTNDNWTDASYTGSFGTDLDLLPLIPTSVGIDLGDACRVAYYDIIGLNEQVIQQVEIPVYFGLKHPFGYLFKWVDGLMAIYNDATEKGTAYVKQSFLAENSYDPAQGYAVVGEIAQFQDGEYISKVLTDKLAFLPTAGGATALTGYCDKHYSDSEGDNPYAFASGGFAIPDTDTGTDTDLGLGAGAFCSWALSPSVAFPIIAASLCCFGEDVIM